MWGNNNIRTEVYVTYMSGVLIFLFDFIGFNDPHEEGRDGGDGRDHGQYHEGTDLEI